MKRDFGVYEVLISFVSTLIATSVAAASPTCQSALQSFKKSTADVALVFPTKAEYGANDLFLKDVRKLIQKDLKLERINKKTDVKWMGPSKPKWPHVTELSFERQLSAGELRWNQADYDRDALTMFTRVLWAISVEQGRREIRSTVFARARYGLITGAYDLTKGNTHHALELLHGALAELIVGHVDARGENLGMNGEKAEWPAGDAPADTHQLAVQLSKSFLQMYRVTSKTGEDPNELITRKIENIISAYTVEARRYLDTESTYGLTGITSRLVEINEDVESLASEQDASMREHMSSRAARDIRELVERMDPSTYIAYLDKRLKEGL